MAELAATCLASEGVRVTMVANRTYERAQAVAEELGARALTLDQAWEHFATADIVLSSTAAPHAVVTWERVAAAIERRGRRPLCILDVAVPRDVEPAVGRLENVFLYDIDDLQTVAAQATAERRKEIPAAEHIVTEEVDRFWTWYGGLAVVPVLKEFRGRLDQVRAQELERALKRLAHLAPEDRAQIEQFSHAAEQVPAPTYDSPQTGGACRSRVRSPRGPEAPLRSGTAGWGIRSSSRGARATSAASS